jgi:glutamyl-Q tRNA(Asp) synthetase
MSQKHHTRDVVTRFAPSPTGLLHVGHGWSALLAHDFARHVNGRFLLRIEDSDISRCKQEFTEKIYHDLSWLGLRWDGLMIQSQRFAAYDAALERLIGEGLAYPCFCSRADIAREVAASLHAPHFPAQEGSDGPLYPGTCRALSQPERAERIAGGEAHSWRLDMAAALACAGPFCWTDERAGEVPVDPHALGDLILKGKDRPASYHLAAVVDDAAQGVTDVVRGRDIFASTHAQRMLQALLDLPTPLYHHHALVVDAQGKRLAKRSAGLALAELREAGWEGAALAADLRAGRFPLGIALEQA